MSSTVIFDQFFFPYKRLKVNAAVVFLAQDIALLNAGKPAQHTAEVDRELDKADNMIRLLFNDVQILKDGRHPQAELMYHRWGPSALHSNGLP